METSRRMVWTLIALLGFCSAVSLLSGCVSSSGEGSSVPRVSAEDSDDEGDGGEEIEVPLEEVPLSILGAAKAAKPGILLIAAEREIENGVTQYEIEGTLNGEVWEIEVGLDGTVLEADLEADLEAEEQDEGDGDAESR